MAHFNKQKAFGQHFLIDTAVINGIVDEAIDALRKNPGHSLLEIGPGNGAITRPLIGKLRGASAETSFFVAERDRELIEYWKSESGITKLLEGDFLKHSEETLNELGPLVVVSNLPYSAGTAIVIRLCERSRQIPEMILMFQAEVAKRLYAESSTHDRGSLSLYVQNEWDVEMLIEVKPHAFKPAPKVMSEVVRLKQRPVPHIDVSTQEKRDAFNDLLKQAFKHRRKMIRGNFGGTAWQKAFESSGVDPTLRAEALEWDHWKAIWQKRF